MFVSHTHTHNIYIYIYIIYYIYIYIFKALSRLTSEVPTVLFFHIAHFFLPHPDVVYNTRKQHAYLGFSARTLSTSFFSPLHQSKVL